MLTKPFVTVMILLLLLAYLGALAVSTAHLSQLYALFNAGLPYSVSIGLAVALEAVALLFSAISTSYQIQNGWTALILDRYKTIRGPLVKVEMEP